jgi:hypothetical protein
MPGPMGVRCARACSATMLVTADEWKARIWRAGEESPRRDYRATEAKIRHRLGMSRWFDEWARRYRPGTRHGSYDLGLTWQWVTWPTPTSTSHPPGGAGSRRPRTAPATASSSHSLDDKQQLAGGSGASSLGNPHCDQQVNRLVPQRRPRPHAW